MKLLGIKDIENTLNKRVWLGHFQREDIMKNLSGSLALIDKRTHGNMKFYKYTRFDIKNKMNPVPSCSKDKIYENNNDFYLSEIKEYEGLGVKRSRISYTFNNFSKEDLYKLHKNSNFYQSELLIVKPPPTIVSRNKPLGQYPYNSFMGTADMLQILEKEIHYHGRNCTGSLNYESKSYI